MNYRIKKLIKGYRIKPSLKDKTLIGIPFKYKGNNIEISFNNKKMIALYYTIKASKINSEGINNILYIIMSGLRKTIRSHYGSINNLKLITNLIKETFLNIFYIFES